MSKKPAIVYGRKKLETKQLPAAVLVQTDFAEEVEPKRNKTQSQPFKDENSNRSTEIKLFSESVNDSSPVAVATPIVKGKKAQAMAKTVAKAKGKGKKDRKMQKAVKSTQPRAKKKDENSAPWAQSAVNFSDYENYSLAVTLEKSKIENLANAPEKPSNNVPNDEVIEPVLETMNRNASMQSEPQQQVHLASTPAVNLRGSNTKMLLGSAKASPVPISNGDEMFPDDVEHVGNAKLPTPKFPTRHYALRSSHSSLPSSSISNSSVSIINDKRRRKAVFSLSATPSVQSDSSKVTKDSSLHKSLALQKSVRFADTIATHKSDPTNEQSGLEVNDWFAPSIIEGSGVHSFMSEKSVSEVGSQTDPITDDEINNQEEKEETDQQPQIGMTELMEDSLQLPSLISIGPTTLSVLPEDITAPTLDTISQLILDEDDLNDKTKNTTVEDSKAKVARPYVPSPIPVAAVDHQLNRTIDSSVTLNKTHNSSGASEVGDVVGELVGPANKSRFAPRVSAPSTSNTSIMNQSSRLADISMRRKSLLVHEISIIDPTSVAKDDPDAFAKSRLTILTPVRERRSNLKLTPVEKLLRACGQTEVLPFDDFFNAAERKACVKIGEGVSGEVFKISIPTQTSRVIKVIPVNGTVTFNDAEQKTFADILAEVVVSRKTTAFAKAATILHERSSSRRTRSRKARESITRKSWEDDESTMNASPNFIAVNRVCVAQGEFPQFLTKLWDKFAATKGSENDHPNRFDASQHFLIFDSVFGGEPLENFKFPSAFQSLALFAQVAVSLAVGESACCFEHRDLHWGNILVHPAEHEKIEYRIGTKRVALASSGFEVSIIDFTLSRCSEDGVVVFTNLSQDEGIFMGEGDFQFEVYRLMRKECNDNWAAYTPRTNCFWLRYLLDKLLNRVVYKVAKSNVQHNESIKALTELLFRVQETKSATDFVYENLIPCTSKLLQIDDA